jgi:hypothetical protein
MKQILLLAAIFFVNSSQSQELPKLLKFNNGPQFSYMDCLNLTKKKDSYCDRHDYTYLLENDTLYVTYTWNYKVNKGKDAKAHHYYYKVAVKDINFSKTIESVPYESKPKVKNPEGEYDYVCGYKLYTYWDKLIASEPKFGGYTPERRSEVFLYADDSYDVKKLMEYLQTKASK